MPFSPYSTPLQFEYKPLGLERFAEPLVQMQKQYDDLSTDIQKPTYAIQSLPGTDEAKASLLQAHYDKQRDEMASNLIKNRNTRGVAKQIAELNQIHTSHPEIQAMQGNLQKYQEEAKVQKKRLEDGKISEDEYNKYMSNAISNYEGKKGLNYDYSTGTHNPLSFKSLSDDLRPEMNERLDALTKMTAADKTAFARAAGVDMSRFTRTTVSGSHEFINEGELNNILRGTIMSDPRYLKSISDRKELDLDYLKYNNPEAYNSDINKTLENTLSKVDTPEYHAKIDALLANGTPAEKEWAKKYMKSSMYSNFDYVQQVRESISNDPSSSEGIARNLIVDNHTQNYVSKMIDPHAKAGSYDKYEQGFSEANLSAAQLGSMGLGEDGKVIKDPVANVVPLSETTPFTVESFDESMGKTRENMKNIVNTLNINSSVGKGTGEFGKVFKNDFDKGNYYQLGDESKKILQAFDKSGGNSFEKFKANYKGKAKPEDLKQLYWNLATDPDKLTNFKNAAGTMSALSTKLKTDEGIKQQVINNYKQTPEYSKKVKDVVEQLEADYESARSGAVETGMEKEFTQKSPLAIAKSYGFKTLEEAVYNRPDLFGKNDLFKGLQTKAYMSVFQIQGTTAVDKALQANTNTYLNQVVGLKGENLRGMKDLDGNDLMSNEKLKGGFKDGEAALGMDSYGRVAIVVPYKLKDGTRINLYTKPKQGIESDGNLNRIAKNIYNAVSTEGAKQFAGELLFNMAHPNNPVNNFYIDPLETTSDKPIDVYQFPLNGTQIKIVKESLKKSGSRQDEQANQYFTVKALRNGNWVSIPDPETGVEIRTADIHLIKAKLGSLYAD